MTPIRYDLAALVDRRAPACGGTKVIAIDGPSGSGKTDFAAGLAATLHAPQVHVEDIYPGWDGLAATPPMLADGILSRLAVGEIGTVRRWDWATGRPSTAIRVPPTPLLIIEGVGSGARICRPYLSVLIWVDAPIEVRKRRALARDGSTFAPYWDRWAAQERTYFVADDVRAAADVLVHTGRDGILVPTEATEEQSNG